MPRKGGKCGGSWGPTIPAAPWPVLERSTVVNVEGLKKVRLVVAADSNEWGRHPDLAGLMASEGECVPRGSSPFTCPPFWCTAAILSGFLDAVFSHYEIHALHLDPCSLVLLSAFAFLCEAFVGVTPSVALLRHFFSLELISEVQCSGVCVLENYRRNSPRGPIR
ncbi:hypothetical protein D1007_27826 [Hordeum vulgare]|nr:hypothetical protein D1007_27826 [Hordeum vulgare]